jgi:hypothetical protein
VTAVASPSNLKSEYVSHPHSYVHIIITLGITLDSPGSLLAGTLRAQFLTIRVLGVAAGSRHMMVAGQPYFQNQKWIRRLGAGIHPV